MRRWKILLGHVQWVTASGLRAGIFSKIPSPQPGDERAVVSRKDDGGSCSQALSPVSAPSYARPTAPTRHRALAPRINPPVRGSNGRAMAGWRRSTSWVTTGARGRSSQATADERTLRLDAVAARLVGRRCSPVCRAVAPVGELARPPPRPSRAPLQAAPPWPSGAPLQACGMKMMWYFFYLR
jgi:hypothetical protein